MSEHKTTFMNDQLSKQTSIFGLRLWVVLGVGVGAAIVILLFLVSLWLTSKRNNAKQKPSSHHHQSSIPNVSRDIQEISVGSAGNYHDSNNNMNRAKVQPSPYLESEQLYSIERQSFIMKTDEESSMGYPRIHIEIGKDHRIVYPEKYGGALSSHGCTYEARSGEQVAMVAPEVSHLGWGHWYTLRELEVSTNVFSDESVIGEGGYGVVYYGLLPDNTQVAVKKLLNNRGQAGREFKVEVEAIGRVRHKNLVRLLGYCAEGAHRMLVYEYVDNGNLEQWLHGEVGSRSPLTWEIRMHIILGTARGLTYLHEGLEPKVIHRDIKSSNILLDKQWNPKVSDFGLAKLLASESSYITTRVMGTFGYVAPEYASTGMLNDRSDVYSFGVLIMEIISGRNPVDYNRPPEEVNLVDWLKRMVANRNPEGILDPKLPEKPSLGALKRLLLVALRCVDPNAHKRPRMGLVIHMLEAEELPFKEDQGAGRGTACANQNNVKDTRITQQVERSEDGSRSENEPNANESTGKQRA